MAFPYIPNSAPSVKNEMLDAIGVRSTDDLYAAIPSHLRYRAELAAPGAPLAEAELVRDVRSLLAQNHSTSEFLSFLGGGCWQHYVPAVCDEVNQRGEFLTAYGAETYADHGKYQAFFE